MFSFSSQFTPEARERVESAIAQAETRTSAEIVVAAAPASGRYDRPEDIAGLLLATVLLAVFSAFQPEYFEFAAAVTILFVGFFAGVGIAMYVPPLRRVLTPREQMLQETTRAAEALFYKLEMRRSASRCGVLLYISFFERTASVMADQTVLDVLGQDGIDALCTELTEALKAVPPAEAIASIVETAGARLAESLPRADDDTDELPNQFLVLS
ncbi:MAG: hypothetical protein GC168_01235 [Candidatus Hydrogenedens sp.]|nr:hypothetical protein [Candidatus Hydrogenedens sp.]